MYHVETLIEALDNYGLYLPVLVEMPDGHYRELDSVVSLNISGEPYVLLVPSDTDSAPSQDYEL